MLVQKINLKTLLIFMFQKNEKVTEKIEGDVDTVVSKIMDVLKNKLKVI